jgi:hypothetical protein
VLTNNVLFTTFKTLKVYTVLTPRSLRLTDKNYSDCTENSTDDSLNFILDDPYTIVKLLTILFIQFKKILFQHTFKKFQKILSGFSLISGLYNTSKFKMSQMLMKRLHEKHGQQ